MKASFILTALLFTTSTFGAELHRQTFSPEFKVWGAAVKVAFFDADSTLRVSRSGSVSANGPTDVELLPWVAEKISQLNRKNYLVVIVSNQAGIPKYIELKDADAALKYTCELIQERGGRIDYFDFAENNDEFRKPNTGMAARLELNLKRQFGGDVYIDKTRSFMVGDSAYKSTDTRPDGTIGTHFSNSDRLFAENYGITFYEPNEYFGWKRFGIDVFSKLDEVLEFKNLYGEIPPRN